jgi:hypothetical protein
MPGTTIVSVHREPVRWVVAAAVTGDAFGGGGPAASADSLVMDYEVD